MAGPISKKRKTNSAGADADAEPDFLADSEHVTSNWARPELTLNTQEDDITFQQIEISDEVVSGQPQVRMFGVTQEGWSVLAHVEGFLPYFYVTAPKGFTPADCVPFMQSLNATQVVNVKSVDWLMAKSLWYYRGDSDSPFLKITLSEPKFVPKLRGMFERGDVGFRDYFRGAAVQTYESNFAYELRFMVDKGIVGMSWVTLKAGKYRVRDEASKVSRMQLEVDVDHEFIQAHAPEGNWSSLAPLRILSFDIECAGRPGVFPEPDTDPVIQIASMVTRQGETKPFIRNIFTLNTCAHIIGSQVIACRTEQQLLSEWSRFIQEADPDIVIGYNIMGFDLPYLIDRAKALKLNQFAFLGRLKAIKAEVKEQHFSSAAFGTRNDKIVEMEGRLMCDMIIVMRRGYSLPSYSLNAVCAHFLGEQKEEVHFSIITELQNGTAESRRRLAVYCLKDAYLPQRLLDKLMCFINYTEMSRVTGVPFNYLLTRGQSIKVLSQLFRQAKKQGYIIPSLKSEGSDEQYEGATVIEPTKGYYDTPIATLDFASLYPSIIRSQNLCYTTLVTKEDIDRLNLQKDIDYVVTPNGDTFVSPSRREGLLPIVLTDLLTARANAKKELKKETDPFKRAVLDGRQLALKISANSVYGFTGATVGKLPCLPISSSTTAYGREMIAKTKQVVEETYTVANGYEFNAEVIYGDTDSVMVKFGVPDVATAMKLGAEAAEKITRVFKDPVKLEFEKVYFPYLLIAKKRYAGLYWTNPDKWDKLDSKGIETVRRDCCRLTSALIETSLHLMLIERDVSAAVQYVKDTISDLMLNKIDLSQLIITKALAKTDYANKQPHSELAARMKIRDAGSAPALGDRVAFVIIKGEKSAKIYEKAEDPIWVLDHNLPLDTQYYLEHQLSNPLMRIFEPIMGEKASSLLAGDHTRTVKIATPTTGGLMGFVVKSVLCLGCKAQIKSGKGAVCPNCRPRIAELYQRQLAEATANQIEFARLWTQCQRCSGSLHQDVLCASKDCPIFFQRRRAQKEVVAAETILERFTDSNW